MTPTAVMGTVSGIVRNGTAGAPTPVVTMQLIAVLPNGQIGAQSIETRDGTFRFAAPADATVTYLLRTEYAGVPYLDPVPVLLGAEAPTVDRTITVWETTDARPSLRIARTTVYVEGIDGATARLQLRREDVVESAGDRVYVGGADRRTLRLPTPDGAVAVDAQQSFDGSADLEQGVVVTTQPLRPGQTTVTTRLLVEYDVRAGEYALRVTAPLPTAVVEVHAPTSLVGGVRPLANAEVAKPVDAGGERWQVTRRTSAAAEGESMVVQLRGLSGLQAANPLTSQRGAATGAAVALGVLAVGALAALQVRRT
ncbi:MAG: hypothetical protein WC211_02625 [Dehalococcoidia bacterium]